MQIDYLSDLHLDFYFIQGRNLSKKDIKKVFDPIFKNKGDVLIMAGDIGHFNDQNYTIIKYIRELYYKNILCVLGNHDYYLSNRIQQDDYDMNSFNRVKEMRELLNTIDGVFCLNGDIIEINGIYFGGCDGWYNNGYFARQYPTESFSTKSTNQQWMTTMYDSEMIKGISNFDDIWHLEKPKIESIYKKCDVMITHVMPSCKNEHFSPRFQNSPGNVFFSFEGEDYLRNGSMKYWVFGHTHENIQFEEHNVKCLSNSFGYPSESGNGQNVTLKSFIL